MFENEAHVAESGSFLLGSHRNPRPGWFLSREEVCQLFDMSDLATSLEEVRNWAPEEPVKKLGTHKPALGETAP